MKNQERIEFEYYKNAISKAKPYVLNIELSKAGRWSTEESVLKISYYKVKPIPKTPETFEREEPVEYKAKSRLEAYKMWFKECVESEVIEEYQIETELTK